MTIENSPLRPFVLEGTHVRLEPLTWAHLPDLCNIGLDPEIWHWTPILLDTPEKMQAYVADALQAQDQGTALPFVTIERASGKVIGSTRFGSMVLAHRRVEIGWTWIVREWRRTAINTEAKYLMLAHAFELLGCNRVEFKTDELNERSRAALRRIGAREEGIFRSHMVTVSGRVRNTVYYSIIHSEWPQVKSRLEEMLQRSYEAGQPHFPDGERS